jgi:tetratricopeptide (TPR) repeat protein
VKPTEHAMADSLTHFTRGLGMARTGNLRGAKAEIDVMRSLQSRMQKSDDAYWAARTEEQIDAVSAWVALAEGATEKAIALMRSAADGESGSIKHVAMENRLYPMRELLGDLLLEARQPSAALAEFVQGLKDYPNRYRGLYGAARAAEALGDRQTATGYYTKLIELSKVGDAPRPELERARAYLRSQ